MSRRWYCDLCWKYIEPQQRHHAFWCFLASTMRRTSWRRKYRCGRVEAGICTVDMYVLESIFKSQKGRCFYSGLPMVLRRGVAWKASPERLDTQKGYVDGNVVLVCSEFNGFRQMSAERIQKMLEDGRESESRPINEDELTQYWKKFKTRNKNINISIEDLIAQHIDQDGRCVFSNVPLTLNTNDAYYQPSIIFPTNGGFRLIIRALQLSSSGRWSKEKYDTLKYHFLVRNGEDIIMSTVCRRRSPRLLQKEENLHVDLQLARTGWRGVRQY